MSHIELLKVCGTRALSVAKACEHVVYGRLLHACPSWNGTLLKPPMPERVKHCFALQRHCKSWFRTATEPAGEYNFSCIPVQEKRCNSVLEKSYLDETRTENDLFI